MQNPLHDNGGCSELKTVIRRFTYIIITKFLLVKYTDIIKPVMFAYYGMIETH